MSLGYAEKLSFREDLGGQLGAPELTESANDLTTKVAQLSEWIAASRKIIVFTGAGISTACGIPDFRGPNGVWTLQRAKKPLPKLKTSFTFAKPSLTHQVLVALHQAGKLQYIVSQNVDSLHLRSGMPRTCLAELHGNCFAEHCPKCKREYLRDFEIETVGFKYTGRRCIAPGCSGRLKDHILDWEDALPDDELDESERQADQADLAICLGTSLQITPACDLPLRTPKAGGKLVIINLQKTPKDKKADLVIHAKCDGVLRCVVDRLKLPVPQFVRRDCVVVGHKQAKPRKGKQGQWLLGYTLYVTSPHGVQCAMPMVESVSVVNMESMVETPLVGRQFTEGNLIDSGSSSVRRLRLLLRLSDAADESRRSTHIEHQITLLSAERYAAEAAAAPASATDAKSQPCCPAKLARLPIAELDLYNATAQPEGSYALPSDDFVMRVDLLPLNKSDAVAYLDGLGPEPERKHPHGMYTDAWLESAIIQATLVLRELFEETTGGLCYGGGVDNNVTFVDLGCGLANIGWLNMPAYAANASQRTNVIRFVVNPGQSTGEEDELFPLPFTFKVVEDYSVGIEAWRAFDLEYCNQGPFASAEELQAAYQAGNLTLCSAPEYGSPELDYAWATTNHPPPFPGNSNNQSSRPGPQSYMPAGRRFDLSSETSGGGRRFNWFGWEGHVVLRSTNGIALFDIQLDGERIIYELALQDMMVAYSGYSGQGQQTFMDSYWGIGVSTTPLRRGYDCPMYATYLPATMNFLDGGGGTVTDALCMFEEDMAVTQWRHTHRAGPNGPHLDAAKSVEFVIRTVATVGNYDYMYDVRFMQDGSIYVKTTMGGYMTTLFWDPSGQTFRDGPFGTRVQKYVLANIHDHMSGWKVDLDVAGPQNRVVKKAVKAGSYAEALRAQGSNGGLPGWFALDSLKYVETSSPETEFGTITDNTTPVVWQFVASNATNAWGQPRGFAIVPDGTSTQLLPADHPALVAAAWAKYNLAVTCHSDNEQLNNAATYDIYNPQSALVSLDTFIDGLNQQRCWRHASSYFAGMHSRNRCKAP
ncbi:hypothetical protein WJX72_010681 [[Myrmecia] bisecta]|uniref:Amine oxidase n=1 Tax=[Myrmecia] bisecta TaxID=41462 RepID=A0AAW1PPN4_9CHLO